MVSRNHTIFKSNKWTDFKERRAKTIDEYIKIKRQSKALRMLLTLNAVNKSLKIFRDNF
jgi:hypothetical protein